MSDLHVLGIEAVGRIAAVEKILEVVCRTTGMGFSAVARVTESHWIACAVRDEIAFGLKPGGELVLQTTICDEIRTSGQLVAIDHVAIDAQYCKHHTPAQYGFQSYISVPIFLPGGQFFGTLCAIDPNPAKVNNPTVINMFNLFAELIASHLESQDRMAASEAALVSERESVVLRDQFIAVLGHDLRNPLFAVQSAAALMKRMKPGSDPGEMVGIITRSCRRMAGLIDNVLDFARGRLGGGLSVRRVVDGNLQAAIDHVITELHTAWPDRAIHREIAIGEPVSADAPRIGQLLSNLLANALTHGDPKSAIWVKALTTDGCFELSVTNLGQTIPLPTQQRLFQPFVRGSSPSQQGLGLGLYIASEIAKAHNGTLGVTSAEGKTTFTLNMPIA